jgi:hypothetical protein|tara:strand:- start:223 stop:447 length:225 start_codon:yes stop_codon:yes gene_type:complete
MEKQITVGKFLAVAIPLLISVIAWVMSVETRLKEASVRIEQNARINAKIEFQQEKILENQTKILIELQNKKNKE